MQGDPTAKTLREGMSAVLEAFRDRHQGSTDPFYWVLRLKQAEAEDGLDIALHAVPPAQKVAALQAHRKVNAYFANVRYAMLDPVTQVWGVLVNALRASAGVERVTQLQRETFSFPLGSLVTFFIAARDRMDVAEQLHRVFRPIPAPECQTLAALFNVNVHVPSRIDEANLQRIVRLLDAEGPLTEEEQAAVTVLQQTGLIQAVTRGIKT
jgi:hypothetical protein